MTLAVTTLTSHQVGFIKNCFEDEVDPSLFSTVVDLCDADFDVYIMPVLTSCKSKLGIMPAGFTPIIASYVAGSLNQGDFIDTEGLVILLKSIT